MSSTADRLLPQLWAKSPRQGEAKGESLVAHTRTVLARVEHWFDLLPALAMRVTDNRLWHRAALAAVLHDFGKAATGFQLQLRNPSQRWLHRHEVLSLAFLEWLLPQDSLDLPWIVAGIVSHHRDKSVIDEKYPSPLDDDDPYDPVALLISEMPEAATDALAQLIRDYIPQWFSRSRLPLCPLEPAIPPNPAADFRANARKRIYRALALYRQFFARLEREPYSSRENLAAIALRGIILLSDHTASAHEVPPPLPSNDLQEILLRLNLGGFEKLYDHQREAALCNGNAILVAPTGSGKTEAAIVWSARQRANGNAGRLFYVLPYQASINAMHQRLSTIFPDLVTLQHSRALQAIYRRLLDNDYYDSASAALIARRQQSLARLHYHPIRVLTPYQLLRSMFRLKGYEMILADAINALMIFDEIHAYEPRRLGMILAMQQYLARHLGVRVLIMTATLPAILREIEERTLGECSPIYSPGALFRSFARHELHLLPGQIEQPAILEQVASTAVGGRSVLVVCNTVHRAKQVYDSLATLLKPRGLEPELLHSRFTAEDRFRKETALYRHMGTRNRVAESRPLVMVATQVVEVSLGIDFDVLFTEPAPLESLVQRFGRINRARRHACCPIYVLTSPVSFPHIYDDKYIAAALDQLADCDGEVLDESTISTRLNKVYSGGIAEEWAAHVEQARSETQAACIDNLRAFQSSPELLPLFERLFDGTEVLPKSLVDRYGDLYADDPIAASTLLVPISYVQLARLRSLGRLSLGLDDIRIADVPYSSDYGLELDAERER